MAAFYIGVPEVSLEWLQGSKVWNYRRKSEPKVIHMPFPQPSRINTRRSLESSRPSMKFIGANRKNPASLKPKAILYLVIPTPLKPLNTSNPYCTLPTIESILCQGAEQGTLTELLFPGKAFYGASLTSTLILYRCCSVSRFRFFRHRYSCPLEGVGYTGLDGN